VDRPLLERVLLGSGREKFDSLLRRTTDVVLSRTCCATPATRWPWSARCRPARWTSCDAYVN